jgi:hypothetical protein
VFYCCWESKSLSRVFSYPFRVGVKSTCLVLASTQTFYSSISDSYNETQDLTGGPGAGKILCSRALMARSSK